MLPYMLVDGENGHYVTCTNNSCNQRCPHRRQRDSLFVADQRATRTQKSRPSSSIRLGAQGSSNLEKYHQTNGTRRLRPRAKASYWAPTAVASAASSTRIRFSKPIEANSMTAARLSQLPNVRPMLSKIRRRPE